MAELFYKKRIASRKRNVLPKVPNDPQHFLFVLAYFLFVSFVIIERNLPDSVTIEGLRTLDLSASELTITSSTLHQLGPHIASYNYETEVLTVKFLTTTINNVMKMAHENLRILLNIAKHNAFPLKFLYGMTNVQKVIVNVGSHRPMMHSLLLNCHFDLSVKSPDGSSDDTDSAVMLKILWLITQDSKILEHSVVFLFNETEKNILQIEKMGKVKTSSAWQFFIKSSSGGVCKLCQRHVNCKGNTTNLMNHLKRHHKSLIEKYKNIKDLPESADDPDASSDTSIASSIAVPRLPSASTSGTIYLSSQMSLMDKEVTLKKSMQMANFQSPGAFSSQPRINNVMLAMKSFQDGGYKAAQITNALLFMVAKDNLPLNTVDKVGCRYLLKVLAPLYKIPGHKQFTDLIDKKYEMLSLLVMQKLEIAESITLTCDVWTEVLNTVSFLGVSAHYIYDNELKSTTVGVFELDKRHTGEYLGEVLLSVCNNWKMTTSKIKAVVTDNAANIVNAVRQVFGDEKHLPCFSHTLNLIPAKMFENLPDLKSLIDKIKTIVTFFKHSVVAADEFRKIQRANSSETPLKLIQEVSTRWSSTYYMLERFLKLIDYITPVLIKLKNSPQMLTAFEVATANECLKMLQPFEEMTREISAERNVTSSKIIPMVHLLYDRIHELKPDSEIGKNLKKYILHEIDFRFSFIEKNELLAIATVLDPRFKKMYFRSNIACANAISKINKQLKNMTQSNIECDGAESSLESEVNEISSVWHKHKDLMIKANNCISKNNFGSNLHIQLKNYLNQVIPSLKTDPIKYWVSYKSTSKHLSSIALDYLSVVGTSVPSERMFSRTGNIMTDNRNRLKGDRLSRLLFLSSLDISDWHLAT